MDDELLLDALTLLELLLEFTLLRLLLLELEEVSGSRSRATRIRKSHAAVPVLLTYSAVTSAVNGHEL